MIRNKKAVSEMVSYVLLIVIAVGLSIAVYSFLKLYASPPNKAPPCPEDVHLVIEDIECNYVEGKLQLTINNKGLFSVDYISIKMAPSDFEIRESVNKGGEELRNSPLAPGDSLPLNYNVTKILQSQGEYTVEIQPAIKTPKGKSVCTNAIATETVSC